mgnify:CR=1 FL=1
MSGAGAGAEHFENQGAAAESEPKNPGSRITLPKTILLDSTILLVATRPNYTTRLNMFPLPGFYPNDLNFKRMNIYFAAHYFWIPK